MLGLSIGESIGLLPMFYSSFLILALVSILHGALFPFSCQIYAMFSGQGPPSVAGRVYAYETVGTIIGGFVCTWFIPHLNTFQTSIWLTLSNLYALLYLSLVGKPDDFKKRFWLP